MHLRSYVIAETLQTESKSPSDPLHPPPANFWVTPFFRRSLLRWEELCQCVFPFCQGNNSIIVCYCVKKQLTVRAPDNANVMTKLLCYYGKAFFALLPLTHVSVTQMS